MAGINRCIDRASDIGYQSMCGSSVNLWGSSVFVGVSISVVICGLLNSSSGIITTNMTQMLIKYLFHKYSYNCYIITRS
jgi:hypothetical protein